MQVIAYRNKDGGISIINPGIKSTTSDGKVYFPIEDSIKFIPKGVESIIIDSSALPDYYFKDVWTIEGNCVVVDMVKAKELHLNKIRRARAKKFVEMGFPYKLYPSLEEAVIPQNVRDELQALRDIPQTINLSAGTPEELKAIWPESLIKF